MTWDNLKSLNKSILVKKRRRSNISNLKYVIHDAENLGLVPIYETKTGKDSTMDQELDICNRVYEIATYNMRRVCVKIKKNNVNKPAYVQIRLFAGKENEATEQVAYVNYTLNEFKEMSKILRDFMFADNCKTQ